VFWLASLHDKKDYGVPEGEPQSAHGPKQVPAAS
jgi:hypothetical protein